MADTTTYVYVDLEGTPHLVGRLFTHLRRRRESSTFEYADEWLRSDHRFALEPGLILGHGAHHTAEGRALFGAIGDSAPDRWGRRLMRRKERRAAEEEGRDTRALREIDFLLGVYDHARQGALRFNREESGPFLAPGGEDVIPPIVELGELLAITQNFLDDKETTDELRRLLAPGSSLGGARPKASVQNEDGSLKIAKFPSKFDAYDEVRWEAVALALAEEAGIDTPDRNLLQDVNGKPVLLLDRFDREGQTRVPFLSAMSMLSAADGQTRSYAEIADALRQHGAQATADCKALWRRVVFNILISNTDDHLRNHGFLYEGLEGWRLCPAYDLVPVPADLGSRMLSTTIDYGGDPSASIDLALENAYYFELELDEAREVARDVADIVAGWREVARAKGVPDPEIDRMRSAFDHENLERALAL